MALKTEFEWQTEDYLRAFWLHRLSIGLLTFLFGGFAAIYMAHQPNIYQTTARVLIESQSPRVVQFQEVTPFADAWDRTFLQTEYRVISSRAVISRVIDELHLAAFPPFSRQADPVEFLQEMIAVEPVRATKLVDIRVTGNKPELIARIANAVADIYARVNLERRRELTIGSIQWLKDEVVKMEQKMRTAQLTLLDFMEKHGTVDFGEEQQNTILQRIRDLNGAITDNRKRKIEAETKYRQMHPQLLELEAKERDLLLALHDQEQLALEMHRLSIQYSTLLSEVKTGEDIYNILLTRQKELSVQEGLQTNNVQLVDYAKVPEVPIGPPRSRAIIISTLLGLLIGAGLGTLLERLVKTLRTRRDFERLVEIPFLGHIPFIRSLQGKEITLLRPGSHSSIAESIRSIRTTLEFLLPTGQSSVLLITSALPEEGKSLIALNLSIALQEMGRKVLLIDGDMRRPSLHRLLQVNLEPGLSGYLQEKAAVEELIQRAQAANGLPVVAAGLSPSQPTDLLGSPKLRTALEQWKKDYQYIVIDTPPVLVAPDSAALATMVDWVIFLIRANRTQGEAAQAGKQRLVDVGAKLIGGILNGARLDLERGYRYYYYYREGKRYRKDHTPTQT